MENKVNIEDNLDIKVAIILSLISTISLIICLCSFYFLDNKYSDITNPAGFISFVILVASIRLIGRSGEG